MDATENTRREMVQDINSQVQSNDKDAERQRLEAQHGQVWDRDQLDNDFVVIGFAAPLVVVKRKSDGKKGSLQFQHNPRFYFGWEEHK